MSNVVIGKRVTIGAAINGVAAAMAAASPDDAVTIMSLSVPIIFIVQIFIANRFGVTTKEG